MKRRVHLACVLCLLASGLGCSAFRPVANRGHDLLENPNRSVAVRLPAGLGALLGHAFAVPFTGLLLPSYFFTDSTVESSDGYYSNRKVGDIQIPLVLAPQDYGSGAAAAIVGAPFDWVASLFREAEPLPPPGTLDETPEAPPGTADPRLRFEPRPPRPGEAATAPENPKG